MADISPLLNTYCNITIRYSPRCLIVIAFKFGFAYCISDRAITAAWCFPRDNRAMPALFSKGEHKRMLLYCACTFAISPLRLRTYGYPCKMCSASVFVVKFKISTRKRCNARINVVHISNMMGNDGIARSWKSDWEPNSGIVVSIASDDNSPLLYANSKPTGVYSSAAKLPIICCI